MLFNSLPSGKKKHYKKMLVSVCSLSRFFSKDAIPYLDYRMSENVYCKVFMAKNVSREDSPVDAIIKKTGVGIKTFRGNGLQKIAELDSMRSFASLSDKQFVRKLSIMRNERLALAKRTYKVNDLIFHCIRREKGKIFVIECPMNPINIDNIQSIKRSKSSVSFSDGFQLYYFNLSKSVLQMRFPKSPILMSSDVRIIEDPFDIIAKKMSAIIEKSKPIHKTEYILLPLYSSRSNGEHVVQEHSGLNQWNAIGRIDKKGRRSPRNCNEVYIRIPSWIHQKFAGFLPSRGKSFDLELPDGALLQAKVCQSGGKALMSAKNKQLGKWILRDILKIPVGQVVTYKTLQLLGIDSVILSKISNTKYSIDFSTLGSFDEFESENKE
jgi:hypothetical protein